MRYELTIQPDFEFRHDGGSAEGSEALPILSEGHTFVWHTSFTENGEYFGPVVSLMCSEDDGTTAALAVHRFVATLSFALDRSIGLGWATTTGFKQETDRPLARHSALRPMMVISPVREVNARPDSRLLQVCGLYREAIAAESPYFRFLALHNALIASFEGNDEDAERYITSCESRISSIDDRLLPLLSSGETLGHHFRDVLRNAIAHAVRGRQSQPTIDPNDPRDRQRADIAATALRIMVRWRIGDRWPNAVSLAAVD